MGSAAMKTFFPIRHTDVAATGTVNGPDACYRVAYGVEHRGGEPAFVFKVLVCSGGRISGRLAPSFPPGSDDFERVARAMAELSDQVRAAGPAFPLVLPIPGEGCP
jgi:hypothetical protein